MPHGNFDLRDDEEGLDGGIVLNQILTDINMRGRPAENVGLQGAIEAELA
jgi:hypothetical protein